MRTPTLDGTGASTTGPEVRHRGPVTLEPIRLEPPGEQRKTPWLWVALITALVLLAASIGAIAWQQHRVNDANASLRASQSRLVDSRAVAGRLDGELSHAISRVARLDLQVARLQAALAGSRTTGSTLAAQLRRAQAHLATARADFRATRAQLLSLAGAPLPDGTWTGRLYMVGGTQTPPVLAFDQMKLFTGQDAVQAMIADGATPAEAAQCEPYCLYWRNPSTEWRIMLVDPNAAVTLQSFHFQKEGGYHATLMSLLDFTRVYNGTAPWNAHFAHASYQLTVANGRVTGIDELNLSP